MMVVSTANCEILASRLLGNIMPPRVGSFRIFKASTSTARPLTGIIQSYTGPNGGLHDYSGSCSVLDVGAITLEMKIKVARHMVSMNRL